MHKTNDTFAEVSREAAVSLVRPLYSVSRVWFNFANQSFASYCKGEKYKFQLNPFEMWEQWFELCKEWVNKKKDYFLQFASIQPTFICTRGFKLVLLQTVCVVCVIWYGH